MLRNLNDSHLYKLFIVISLYFVLFYSGYLLFHNSQYGEMLLYIFVVATVAIASVLLMVLYKLRRKH